MRTLLSVLVVMGMVGMMAGQDAKPPEPPDVPAVQLSVTSSKPGSRIAGLESANDFPCLDGQQYEKVDGFDDLWECRGVRVTGTKWTCADKSRILLTAEDGQKWCHKPETK